MSVLTRANYIPNTLIQSAPVNTDFNQLVDLLSGVSTTKDALIKFSHATDPVLRLDQLGAGAIQRWLQNGVERASLSALGKLLLPAGIGATPSTDQISNFGTYFVDVGFRQTGADTNETDFSSKTVAANTFAADGDFAIVMARLAYANNANTKRYRLYWDGNVIFDTTAQVLTNVSQFLIGIIFRDSSTSLRTAFGSLIGAAINPAVSITAITTSFTANKIFKSTGQNGAASAADIVQAGFFMIKGSV